MYVSTKKYSVDDGCLKKWKLFPINILTHKVCKVWRYAKNKNSEKPHIHIYLHTSTYIHTHTHPTVTYNNQKPLQQHLTIKC